jgi:hypothetical protein
MATALQTYEQKCEARCRATPIHCAPSQVTEDRVIFREVAIKMPLSVALLFLPLSHPKRLAYRTHSCRPNPRFGGGQPETGWAQEPICIATVSAG